MLLNRAEVRMSQEQELPRLLEKMHHELGITSAEFQHVPQVVNALLLLTHPRSPIFNKGLAAYVGEWLKEVTGHTVTVLPEEAHNCCQDVCRGIMYVQRKVGVPLSNMMEYYVTPGFELPNGSIYKHFLAALVGEDNCTLLLHPRLFPCIARSSGQDRKREHTMTMRCRDVNSTGVKS